MSSRPRGCDYCLQTVGNNEGDQLHQISLSRTPNGDKLLQAELCSTCLGEITVYALNLAAATRQAQDKRGEG